MTQQPRILVLFGNVPLLGEERADIETMHVLMESGCAEWNNSFALDLKFQVRRAGIADRTVFTGFVENIDALYLQAAVHLCPSLLQEGYGPTVVEARFRALPSIVFLSGALTELVTDGVDGIVCGDKTVESLQQAIEQYLLQPDMAHRHGVRANESLRRLALVEFPMRWKGVYERSMRVDPSRTSA